MDQSTGAPRPKVEVQSLTTRGYLDHTVVPILLDGMAVVARERYMLMSICQKTKMIYSVEPPIKDPPRRGQPL